MIWILVLSLLVPPLIAFKGTQQAGYMLEGWARRAGIAIADGPRVLMRDKRVLVAVAVMVGAIESAVIMMFVALGGKASVWWTVPFWVAAAAGALLHGWAIGRVYREFKRRAEVH